MTEIFSILLFVAAFLALVTGRLPFGWALIGMVIALGLMILARVEMRGVGMITGKYKRIEINHDAKHWASLPFASVTKGDFIMTTRNQWFSITWQKKHRDRKFLHRQPKNKSRRPKGKRHVSKS
jgi:hypothetical protein